MADADIKIYGTTWGSDCTRSKEYLTQHGIEYEWINIETQPDLQEYVSGLNNGNQIVPTIVFPDGTFLAEPSNLALAKKLGIS